MRRLMLIPALALFLAVPLWAQHGGGHGGGGGGHAGGGFGGGHAGFSGGHSSGFSGGGHVSGGVRSAPGVSRGFARGPAFSSRSASSRPFLHDGFRGNRNRTYRYRNGCYGYGCRGYGSYYGSYYPWTYGYYDPYWYDPNWFWDSDSSYDDDSNQNVAEAAEMNRQSLAQQAEEQQMMRQEQADGDQDLYARPVPRRPVPHEAEGAPILPDTMLVFRDQHKQEVRNYAIVGQTLWNFAPQHTEKIPLSDLDLPATTKANEERGVTFRVPASGEAQ
ncbi:MAG TPA: hypothetical protein VKF84_01640 [Candidatus Sulfotelmatobacter sp.]|nr:hypothetical protein [Candidatus Sulfotelmatobacter sp.]